MLSIGLMSGTSMDGIDAALLETDGESQVISRGKHSIPYTSEMKILLRAAEKAMQYAKGHETEANEYFMNALALYLSDELNYSSIQLQKAMLHLQEYVNAFLKTNLKEIQLTHVIKISTLLHAEVITQLHKKLNLTSSTVDCIGYHGQTLYHQPHLKKTIQVGDGLLLAQLTQITVINNFREKDVSLGGQGAPFAPLYHQALAVRDQLTPVAIINCGGIANISLILSDTIEDVFGFDTGPGNGLLDKFVKKMTQGQFSMDQDGQFAAAGVVNKEVLEQLMNHSIKKNSYFTLPPPKSLDLEDIQWIPKLDQLSLADGCATLTAFTTVCILLGISSLKSKLSPTQFIISGGGAFNPVICNELQTRLDHYFNQPILLKTAQEIGWDAQALEAELMAYFAVRSLKQLPLSTPHTTGVPYPVSGGDIHLSPAGPSTIVEKILKNNRTC